jgi:hypothetical protein
MENVYQIDLPPQTVLSQWLDFEHELDFPAAGAQVRFEPVDGEPQRTRIHIDVADADAARIDYALRQFRLFLDSRGLIELSSGPR